MMTLDAWLPIGYKLPDGSKVKMVRFVGDDWQILETMSGGHALVVQDRLMQHWLADGLIEPYAFADFSFGTLGLYALYSGAGLCLRPVNEGLQPRNKAQSLEFAGALNVTRSIVPDLPLQDALYVQKISRLLPVYSQLAAPIGADVVLGRWLTGGVNISAISFEQLSRTVSWMPADQLMDVVQAAGFVLSQERLFATKERVGLEKAAQSKLEHVAVKRIERAPGAVFELAGREELAAFFNEHIIDIVEHRERYSALGIKFPAAIVLHGPPGCGKTFAIERLIEFLGWPSFQIDAMSIGSAFIHETSRKVAKIFDEAIANAPSVLVIDEMEAFLASRDMSVGSSRHHLEEIAEFLRRIPQAAANQVLMVAMTNRIDLVDPAILRRGRFDHLIKVDFATEQEVLSLLNKLLGALPCESDVDARFLAQALKGRPFSDVAFVVHEGGRLAARSGRQSLDQANLLAALRAVSAREHQGAAGQHRMGFI
jgi:AAA+ superfamily predicted ATPase